MSDAFANVQERFFQVVSDLAGEGDSCERNSCDSVEVFQAYLAGYVFAVEVTDLPVSVWEAWHHSEVYVVGTGFSACEFEDAEFQGVYFVENFGDFNFSRQICLFGGQVFTFFLRLDRFC